MAPETPYDLFEIRKVVALESFRKRTAQKELSLFIQELTDETLDKINLLRVRIVGLSERLEVVCTRVQALSWEFTNPTDLELEVINEIVILGKYVSQSYLEMIRSLEPLSRQGIVKKEIDEFRSIVDHWEEVLDDTQCAFFTLPSDTNFIDTNCELESL